MRGWLAMVTVAGLACQQAETAEQAQARMQEETTAFRTWLEAEQTRFEAWEAAGQADSVASMYTDNAVAAFANQPPLMGRQAVRDNAAMLYAMGTAGIDVRTVTAMANGDLAVEHGRYVYTFTPGPTAPPGMADMFPDSGSYIIHWHRVNGAWKIADLVVNSMKPLPGTEAVAGSQPGQ
jgi:ketosteroid isomerase-like protein